MVRRGWREVKCRDRTGSLHFRGMRKRPIVGLTAELDPTQTSFVTNSSPTRVRGMHELRRKVGSCEVVVSCAAISSSASL